jgi:hypothetical protein
MKWLFFSLLFLGSLAKADDLDVTVAGPDKQGVYQVQGYMEADASTSVAWNVLTDYNHMSEFLPSITSSTISGTNDGVLLVRQTFVAKFLFFNHSADALFEIILIPNLNSVSFTDVLHNDFIECTGIWSIVSMNGHSGIIYNVKIIPSVDAPHWIVRSVSRKMAVTLLAQLRKEMERRNKEGL